MNRKQRYWITAGLIFVFSILISASFFLPEPNVCFNSTCFNVEIADDFAERANGLMYRESLDEGAGMLFIFEEADRHAFWMKNTLISLDMFWLDESGTILHLESDVPVCTRKDDGCPRYQSPHKSLQILELNAGMAKKFDLAVGSQLTIDLPPMSFPY